MPARRSRLLSEIRWHYISLHCPACRLWHQIEPDWVIKHRGDMTLREFAARAVCRRDRAHMLRLRLRLKTWELIKRPRGPLRQG